MLGDLSYWAYFIINYKAVLPTPIMAFLSFLTYKCLLPFQELARAHFCKEISVGVN